MFSVGDKVRFKDSWGQSRVGVVTEKCKANTANYKVKSGPFIWTINGCLLWLVEEQDEMRTSESS